MASTSFRQGGHGRKKFGGAIVRWEGLQHYPYQEGNGFAEFMSKMVSRFGPVALQAIGNFVTGLMTKRSSGIPYREAAKDSAIDAGKAGLKSLSENLQRGSGRRRRRKRVYKHQKTRRKTIKHNKKKTRKSSRKTRKSSFLSNY